MPKVEIYTTPFCPYSWGVKKIFKEKGVEVEEIDLFMFPKRKAEMLERTAGKASIPQILINDVSIGGSDDLRALEDSGELDRLLQEKG